MRPERVDGAPGIREVRAARGQVDQPYRLVWADRELHRPAAGQLRIDVPLLGWFTPPDFGYRLSQLLHGLWVDDATFTDPAIVAVAAHVAQVKGRRCLILLITIDAPDPRLLERHEPRLVRDLEDAIVQTSGPALR